APDHADQREPAVAARSAAPRLPRTGNGEVPVRRQCREAGRLRASRRRILSPDLLPRRAIGRRRPKTKSPRLSARTGYSANAPARPTSGGLGLGRAVIPFQCMPSLPGRGQTANTVQECKSGKTARLVGKVLHGHIRRFLPATQRVGRPAPRLLEAGTMVAAGP